MSGGFGRNGVYITGWMYIRGDDYYEEIHHSDEYNDTELKTTDDTDTATVNLLNNVFLLLSDIKEKLSISTEDWQYALYQSNRTLGEVKTWEYLEPRLVKELLSIGNATAIRRYAKKEKIYTSAALAATVPYGITALLYRFFTEEGMPLISDKHRQCLIKDLEDVLDQHNLTAYDKTSLIRQRIYDITRDVWGINGPKILDTNRTRQTLSLIRLYFSLMELKNKRFNNLLNLDKLYESRRKNIGKFEYLYHCSNKRYIENWQLQHIWPFTYYYHAFIREALERGKQEFQRGKSSFSERDAFVNELALAYCYMQAFRNIRIKDRGQNLAKGNIIEPYD